MNSCSRTRSGETRNSDRFSPDLTRDRLVTILARAFAWDKLLEEGRFHSTRELAVALGKDPSYVARVLRLNPLAPDIVQAILDGCEPDSLSYMN